MTAAERTALSTAILREQVAGRVAEYCGWRSAGHSLEQAAFWTGVSPDRARRAYEPAWRAQGRLAA